MEKVRGRVGVSRQDFEKGWGVEGVGKGFAFLVRRRRVRRYWKVLGGVYVSLQFFDIKTRLGRCGERFSFLFRFYWEDEYWVFLGKS